MRKVLIAYYSRKGENYVNGQIKNLKVGNTSIIANFIQKYTQGDIFEIETVKEYSKDYHECTLEAKEELNSNSKPILKRYLSSVDDYDVIFIGYPNWWGTYPMSVLTFLESINLSQKIIIPFCTHEGSGMGNSLKDLKKVCKDSYVLDGKSIKGSIAISSELAVKQWIDEIREELKNGN